MVTRAVEISEEEAEAREAIGLARQEGRTIPSPAVVIIPGESLMILTDISNLCGVSEEDVVAMALQDLYLKVKEREKQEKSAPKNDRKPVPDTQDDDQGGGGESPFKPF